MSSVHQIREDLGQRLRRFRRDSGLTGYALAARLGWAQSKISKIENGRQTPTETDILGWTTATGHRAAAPELIASLRILETMYAEWRRRLHGGMQSHQVTFGDLESSTTMFRVFECMFVPGLLQTPDYMRALMAESIEFYGLPDDLDEAIHARMRRQQILYRVGKTFHFVITEAVLRYQFCPPDAMIAQLDRLIALSGHRSLRFGVIPFTAAYRFSPPHGFWIFDDRTVIVETISAELTLTQHLEIEQHAVAFERLAASAVYGSEARRLVTRIIDDAAPPSE